MRHLVTFLVLLAALPSVAPAQAGASGSPARAIQSVPSPKVGAPFSLRDTTDRRFTSAMLAGKPYVLFFGYTFCPDVCPTTLLRLARLRRALGPQGDALAIVLVTVDPARDTPAALKRYVAAFHTPIVALTGAPAEIARLTRAYHVFVRRGPNGLIDHSGTPYLIGRDGTYRALLSGDDASDLALLRKAIAS